MQHLEPAPGKNLPLIQENVIEEHIKAAELLLVDLRKLKRETDDGFSSNERLISEIETLDPLNAGAHSSSNRDILLELRGSYEKSRLNLEAAIAQAEIEIAKYRESMERRRAEFLEKFDGPAQ